MAGRVVGDRDHVRGAGVVRGRGGIGSGPGQAGRRPVRAGAAGHRGGPGRLQPAGRHVQQRGAGLQRAAGGRAEPGHATGRARAVHRPRRADAAGGAADPQRSQVGPGHRGRNRDQRDQAGHRAGARRAVLLVSAGQRRLRRDAGGKSGVDLVRGRGGGRGGRHRQVRPFHRPGRFVEHRAPGRVPGRPVRHRRRAGQRRDQPAGPGAEPGGHRVGQRPGAGPRPPRAERRAGRRHRRGRHRRGRGQRRRASGPRVQRGRRRDWAGRCGRRSGRSGPAAGRHPDRGRPGRRRHRQRGPRAGRRDAARAAAPRGRADAPVLVAGRALVRPFVGVDLRSASAGQGRPGHRGVRRRAGADLAAARRRRSRWG